MPPFEVKLQDFLIGVVRYFAATGSGAVQSMVMHENQHPVLSFLEVQFHHVHAHLNHGLNGRKGILRIIAPVSPVGHHYHILRMGILQGENYGIGPIGGFGKMR